MFLSLFLLSLSFYQPFLLCLSLDISLSFAFYVFPLVIYLFRSFLLYLSLYLSLFQSLFLAVFLSFSRCLSNFILFPNKLKGFSSGFIAK